MSSQGEKNEGLRNGRVADSESPVQGQLGPGLGEDERIAEAEAEFDEGLRHFQASRLNEACQHFERSYELDPLPGVLFTWATCEARSGRLVTGHRLYGEFVSLVASLPEEERRKQEARLEVAQEEQQKLKAEFPLLRVRVHLEPDSEYQVFLDDVELPSDALMERRAVDPGEHWLRLRSKGQLLEERRVYLRVRDDVLVGIGRPVMRREEQPVVAVPTRPEPSDAWRQPWLYATAGTAAVSISLGGVLGIVAAAQKGKLDCDDDACNGADATSRAKKAQSIANASTAFFVIGGVAAGASALIYFLPAREGARAEGDLAVGVGFNSIRLAGSF